MQDCDYLVDEDVADLAAVAVVFSALVLTDSEVVSGSFQRWARTDRKGMDWRAANVCTWYGITEAL